jgi:hypothetical protein
LREKGWELTATNEVARPLTPKIQVRLPIKLVADQIGGVSTVGDSLNSKSSAIIDRACRKTSLSGWALIRDLSLLISKMSHLGGKTI